MHRLLILKLRTHLNEQSVSGDPLVRLGEQVRQTQALALVAGPPHVLHVINHELSNVRVSKAQQFSSAARSTM